MGVLAGADLSSYCQERWRYSAAGRLRRSPPRRGGLGRVFGAAIGGAAGWHLAVLSRHASVRGGQRSLFGGVAMGPRGGFVLNRSFWPASKIALAGKIVFLTLGLNTREPTFKISVLPAGRVLLAGYAVRSCSHPGAPVGAFYFRQKWPPH